MAVFLFVRAIMASQPIRLFKHGVMRHDFTYVDEVTCVVSKLIDVVPAACGQSGCRNCAARKFVT